jgi:uncharacterized protein (TIGR02118 family)
MIKLVYCIRKSSDVSADEFYKYWLEKHGPLVKKLTKDIRAVKYVQSHTIAPEMNAMFRETREYEAPYDGITEVWWNSLEDMQAGYATKAGAAAGQALAEDEAKFIDFKQSAVFMTEEHDIF